MAVTGRCLCGAVEFEIANVDAIDACHCNMCRRWHGGPHIGVDFRGEIDFRKADSLAWYESSDWAKRGFCRECGSTLFYKLKQDPDFWSIAAGALDLAPGHAIEKEIFVDEKPDYYNLAGDQRRLTGDEFLAEIQMNAND